MEDMQHYPEAENEELPAVDEGAKQIEADTGKADINPSPDSAPRPEASMIHIWRLLTACIATWATLIVLLCGAASAFSKTVHLVTVIEFIIELFSLHYGVIYETLAKAAIAIAFCIILVILIKGGIQITKVLVKQLSPRAEKASDKLLRPAIVSANSSLALVLCFIILCYVLSGDPLTAGSYAVFIIASAFMLLSALIGYFPRKTAEPGEMPAYPKGAWAEYVFAIVRQLLLLSLMFVLGFLVVVPAGYDLGFNIPALFRIGVSSGVDFLRKIYEMLLRGIIDIVAIALFMCLPRTAFNTLIMTPENSQTIRTKFNHMFISILALTAISAAFTFILAIVDVNGHVIFETNTLKTCFILIRERLLPLICTAIAGIVFLNVLPNRETTDRISA